MREELEREIVELLSPYPKARSVMKNMLRDTKVEKYQHLSNLMAMDVFGLTDHGRVHMLLVARNAIRIAEVLKEDVELHVEKLGIGDRDDAMSVIVSAAFIHDIGNGIHRKYHERYGMILAKEILEEYLDDPFLVGMALQCVYTHQDDQLFAPTFESSIVKVADGTDITEGRARIPYRKGEYDIHLVSALSIERVEILHGDERPLRIEVYMKHSAGLFQVEEILGKKLKSSLLRDMTEVITIKGNERHVLHF